MDEKGWPQAGEIDIMEWVSRKPHEAVGTIHGPGYCRDEGCGGRIALDELCHQQQQQSFAEDFHEFAIEWKPGYIAW